MLESKCRFAEVDELQSPKGFPPRVCVADYPYVNNRAKPCRQRVCVCVSVTVGQDSQESVCAIKVRVFIRV